MKRNNLEKSKILDDFDINGTRGETGRNEERNDFFAKKDSNFERGRGGFERGYRRNGDFHRGGGNGFFNERGGYGGRGRPNNDSFGRNEDNFENRREFQNNRGGYQRGGRPGYGHGEMRGGRGYQGRPRGGRGYYRDKRDFNDNFRGGRNPRPFDQRDFYRDNNNNDNNYYRNEKEKNIEDNEEYEMKKEALYEKEKYNNDLKKKYSNIIEAFKILFINEQLYEEEIIEIIKKLNSNPSLTIFEAMNLIYREVQVIKTLKFYNSGQKRIYGPNKDILEEECDNYNNKNNLKEVIHKYKIYEVNTENYHSLVQENSWLYNDNSDKRRKLLKDEGEYFNYLPILNPNESNNNEDDIYSKNENELLYHFLFYKTLMCKYCDLSDENNSENELCPYSHNILKDFRIIYNYKDEEVSSFMIKLMDSNLFQFENYLNYIPMSLSPDFNLDTFKVHKCQLDKSCPNDYHLCPYYHSCIDGDNQRRPPLLFGYTGNTGDLCFDEKRKKYRPKKCKFGIFCQYLHNRNEYNYHPEHFRKEYECKREKVKGKCKFYKTCYGIHSDKSDDDNSDSESEKEKEIKQEEIENDDKVKESKKKVDFAFDIGKTFRCRKCQKVSINGELVYYITCKHFSCMKCFKKFNIENNKKNKKDKKLLCPLCYNELKKKEALKTSFIC